MNVNKCFFQQNIMLQHFSDKCIYSTTSKAYGEQLLQLVEGDTSMQLIVNVLIQFPTSSFVTCKKSSVTGILVDRQRHYKSKESKKQIIYNFYIFICFLIDGR